MLLSSACGSSGSAGEPQDSGTGGTSNGGTGTGNTTNTGGSNTGGSNTGGSGATSNAGSGNNGTGGSAGGSAGNSVASAHCGDKGIENDSAVVFVERFDEGSIAAAQAKWDNTDSASAMSIINQVPPGAANTTASRWHYESSDAFTVGFVKNLAGFDQLWFRYYVRIASAGDPIWHFFRMGGGSPYGGANVKPDGTDRFTSSVEPNYDRQKWDFYTYWVDMRADSAGNHYGNNFLGEDFNTYRDLAQAVETGRWVSVEMMIKMNTVGSYDGEQAFWIDGQPRLSNYSGGGAAQIISAFAPGTPKGSWITAHFCPDTAGQPFDGASGTAGNGMRWRTVGTLNINYIRPIVYNDHAQPNAANNVDVSNIVVAKSYVGPIVACP